ncbi:uncharacterized protein LOC127289566 [Leptopilina boulardi]|uniref:uncharacterized protein LOC127289566 n=1 Tax=Leptopilina boulardi TaxID=63433 RepID=UPI0021F530F2|nr:uncharacterized protein LOC127289566 [Leptopilina boulardi]
MLDENEVNIIESETNLEIGKENNNDELEDSIYSSKDEFEAICVGDLSSELTGYVKSIKASKKCGGENQYRIMNFTLSNDEDAVCHVSVWNEEINRIEPDLILNSVINIAGAEIKNFKDPKYNNGNQKYEMIIRKNTVVTLIKNQRCIKNDLKGEIIKLIDFEDLKTENGLILHLDGVSSRKIHHMDCNEANMNFELSIQSNTEINFLGIRKVEEEVPKCEDWSLKDIGKANSEQISKYIYIYIDDSPESDIPERS